MTVNEQKIYARKARSFRRRQERRAYALALAALRRVLQKSRQLVESSGGSFPDQLSEQVVSQNDIRSLFEGIYNLVGPAFAVEEFNLVEARRKVLLSGAASRQKRAPDLFGVGFFSQRWRALMMQIMGEPETAARISGVTERIRRRFRDVLQEAAGARLTVRQTARLLDQKLGGSRLKNHALTIARTETTRAANLGAEMGAQNTGLLLEKVWIATADSRTRDAHRAMLGKKPIPKDDTFVVGGRRMKYPGDPAGGAANCVNCRCVVSYVPVMENGRVLLAGESRTVPGFGGQVPELVDLPDPPSTRTAAEAEAYARTHFFREVDYSGLEAGQALRINKTLQRIQNKLGLHTVDFKAARLDGAIPTDQAYVGFSWGGETVSEYRMAINKRIYQKLDAETRFVEAQTKLNQVEGGDFKRWATYTDAAIGKSLELAVAHEYAHFLEFRFGKRYFEKALKEAMAGNRGGPALAGKVSEYATTRPSEAFAESMAFHLMGLSKHLPKPYKTAAQQYADYVKEQVNRLKQKSHVKQHPLYFLQTLPRRFKMRRLS